MDNTPIMANMFECTKWQQQPLHFVRTMFLAIFQLKSLLSYVQYHVTLDLLGMKVNSITYTPGLPVTKP